MGLSLVVAGGFRWWLVAEKRKKKDFGELSLLEKFSAGGSGMF